MTTRVIHVNEMYLFPDAVYVGRRNPRRGLEASPFANPFKIGKFYGDGPATRLEVLNRYRDWMHEQRALLDRLAELDGKPLACWCRRSDERKTIDTMCHADVLIDLMKWMKGPDDVWVVTRV